MEICLSSPRSPSLNTLRGVAGLRLKFRWHWENLKASYAQRAKKAKPRVEWREDKQDLG